TRINGPTRLFSTCDTSRVESDALRQQSAHNHNVDCASVHLQDLSGSGGGNGPKAKLTRGESILPFSSRDQDSRFLENSSQLLQNQLDNDQQVFQSPASCLDVGGAQLQRTISIGKGSACHNVTSSSANAANNMDSFTQGPHDPSSAFFNGQGCPGGGNANAASRHGSQEDIRRNAYNQQRQHGGSG
ncbi:unnamed protein product, partial [Amoebophrya sp. A25]